MERTYVSWEPPPKPEIRRRNGLSWSSDGGDSTKIVFDSFSPARVVACFFFNLLTAVT
jgi:hypothetical protein